MSLDGKLPFVTVDNGCAAYDVVYKSGDILQFSTKEKVVLPKEISWGKFCFMSGRDEEYRYFQEIEIRLILNTSSVSTGIYYEDDLAYSKEDGKVSKIPRCSWKRLKEVIAEPSF